MSPPDGGRNGGHAAASLRLGVDLGGTEIAAALLAPDGSEAGSRRTPTPYYINKIKCNILAYLL